MDLAYRIWSPYNSWCVRVVIILSYFMVCITSFSNTVSESCWPNIFTSYNLVHSVRQRSRSILVSSMSHSVSEVCFITEDITQGETAKGIWCTRYNKCTWWPFGFSWDCYCDILYLFILGGGCREGLFFCVLISPSGGFSCMQCFVVQIFVCAHCFYSGCVFCTYCVILIMFSVPAVLSQKCSLCLLFCPRYVLCACCCISDMFSVLAVLSATCLLCLLFNPRHVLCACCSAPAVLYVLVVVFWTCHFIPRTAVGPVAVSSWVCFLLMIFLPWSCLDLGLITVVWLEEMLGKLTTLCPLPIIHCSSGSFP